MKITTAAEMREIDRVTSEKFGVHSLALMEAAGTAVANFARAYWSNAERVTVLCGKGNNGGDGFVAARRLHHIGKVVEVLLLGDPTELKGDAANMFARLPFRPVVIRSEVDLQNELTRSLGNAELVIDAILGTGFKPPVTGLAAAAIQAVNKISAPVLAVDVPSGTDADAFGPQVATVMRADAIVTFTAPRPAHLFSQLTRGPIIVAPIGSPEAAVVSKLNLHAITAPEVARTVQPRPFASNKGSFGHVLVVGGSAGKSGAAAMAGVGALRAGAGLVTVATPRCVVAPIASYAPELMVEAMAETQHGTLSLDALEGDHIDRLLHGKTVLALGPGVSRHPETVQFVRNFLKRSAIPAVLDADALNAFEGAANELHGYQHTTVITPHPGEMARLTGKPVTAIQADRIGTARAFAREHQCITVLKGYRTVIAAPDGQVWVNTTGNAGLATGGTGDVLTGMVAGLLAQFPAKPMEAVCAAVYLHGLAGDLARDAETEQAMIATDLLRFAGRAMANTRANEANLMVRVG